MTRSLSKIALLCLISLTSACLFVPEEEEATPWQPVEPPPVVEEEEAVLDGFYLSGHMGSYYDCPYEGYSERPSSDEGDASSPSRGVAPEGDCAVAEPDGGDIDSGFVGCGGGFGCESAQVTIRLSNTKEHDAVGVSIEKIELIKEDDTVATTLPLITVVDLSTGETFAGALEANEEIMLRIEFQGPSDLSEFLPDQNSFYGEAVLDISVDADNAEAIKVRTKKISTRGDIAT